MRSVQEFANIEKLVGRWLQTQTGKPVYSETAVSIDTVMPCFTLAVSGGGGITDLDREVLIELEAFTTTRGDLWALALKSDALIRSLSQSGTEDFYVDDVRTVFVPVVEPYANSSIYRTTATYGLTIRPLAVNN